MFSKELKLKFYLLVILFNTTILFASNTDIYNNSAILNYNNKNYKEAFRDFEISAKKGSIFAQHHLALMYQKGKGVLLDLEKSVYWHKQAAYQGHAVSQYILAEKYYKGDFLPKNNELAIYWYKKSANQNSTNAQYKLGLMYLHGIDLENDYKKAKYWLLKAIEGKHKYAKKVWSLYKLNEK